MLSRGVIALFFCLSIVFQVDAKKILVVPIEDDIDARMSRLVDLALKEGAKSEYDYIVFSINTYGGALQDADKIRTALLNLKKPHAAYINKNAASAGALISIACEKIYMQEGSSIGAATVVNGQDGQAMPDKYQSYMRSMMRATAESRGRNPAIAEAMVDPDVRVDTTIKKDSKVLTLTTSEALKLGFCDGVVPDLDSLVRLLDLKNAEVVRYQPSDSEKIIAFFLHPAVSSILILLILGGIYFELQTPGVGFPLVAAIVAALLYFTPYYLNGLAENWEILVFVVGLILIGLELFVLPGFGIAGIAGIVLMLSGLILAMLGNAVFDFSMVQSSTIETALITVLSAFLLSLGILFLVGRKALNSNFFKKISLESAHIEPPKETVLGSSQLIGKTALATTDLRPSGKIQLDGNTYDAIADNAYVDAGTPVLIIGEFSGSLKVKKFL